MSQGVREHRASAGNTSWLPSGNVVVWKRAFEMCGGFDTALVTCEDVDLSRRLRQSGFRLINDPALRSIHYGDAKNLKAVFKGELWRGRDNLKVSLRERLTVRAAPGVIFPIVFLSALTLVPASLFFAGQRRLLILAGSLVPILGILALRTAVTLSRVRVSSVLDVPYAGMFSAAYEAARALALVVRVPHRRARRED
jgi:hypothetical protein